MLKLIHPIAGATALLTASAFWVATASSELLGQPAAVLAVKAAIAWGMLLLIPAMMLSGGAGMLRARGRRSGLIGVKLVRTRLVAANGLLVLMPSAIFLAGRAADGRFDALFYTVQGIELLAGGFNIAMLALSMRDGLRMTGRLRVRRPARAAKVRPARA